MDRSTFRKIVLKSAFQKRKMYESFLENVSLLKHLEVSNVLKDPVALCKLCLASQIPQLTSKTFQFFRTGCWMMTKDINA